MNRFALGAAAALAPIAFSAPASAESHRDMADDDMKSAAMKSTAQSGEYKPDSGHFYVTFSYLHQGYSRPVVRWNDVDATLDWNADDPTESSVTATIQAASVDSGVEKFDAHLKSDDFFDVENFPTITFTSTALEKTGDDTGTLTGDLTIKDNTKPVTLDVIFRKGDYNARAKAYKLGFSASGKVMRSDFGVGAFAPAVGDEVEINIQTEFEMPAEAPDAE